MLVQSMSLLLLLPLLSCTTLAEQYQDTPETTLVWTLISTDQITHLHQFFIDNPSAMMARSADGRGALWWAWEYHSADALAVLSAHGIDLHYSKTDLQGNRPQDLCAEYESVLSKAQSLVESKKVEKQMIEEQIKREREAQFFDDDDDDDLDEFESDDDDDDVADMDDDFASVADAADDDDNEFFHDEF